MHDMVIYDLIEQFQYNFFQLRTHSELARHNIYCVIRLRLHALRIRSLQMRIMCVMNAQPKTQDP